MHGGLKTRTRVNMHYIESTDIEQHGTARAARAWMRSWCPAASASAASRARSRRCAMRASTACRTWASASACRWRSSSTGATCSGLTDANSTEFNRATPHPVIALITEWQDQARGAQTRDEASGKGGTMRLGAQEVLLGAGTRAREIYGARRHHGAPPPPLRVQQQLPRALSAQAGLRFSGFSRDGLVEIIELPEPPLVRGDPVPPGVHLHAARRPSAVHRLHPRRARAPRRAAAAGGASA